MLHIISDDHYQDVGSPVISLAPLFAELQLGLSQCLGLRDISRQQVLVKLQYQLLDGARVNQNQGRNQRGRSCLKKCLPESSYFLTHLVLETGLKTGIEEDQFCIEPAVQRKDLLGGQSICRVEIGCQQRVRPVGYLLTHGKLDAAHQNP